MPRMSQSDPLQRVKKVSWGGGGVPVFKWQNLLALKSRNLCVLPLNFFGFLGKSWSNLLDCSYGSFCQVMELFFFGLSKPISRLYSL